MPVIAALADEYRDRIAFVAVAGRSDADASTDVAGRLFGSSLPWGYDDDLWPRYEVFGQPTSVLVTGDDIEFDRFYVESEAAIREKLDALLAVGS